MDGLGLHEFATSSPFAFGDPLGLIVAEMIEEYGVEAVYETVQNVSKRNFFSSVTLSSGKVIPGL